MMKASIRTARALAALLISASLLPLTGLAMPRNPMNISGVIDYDSEVPVSEVTHAGNAVDGLVVSLSTTTPALKVKQPALLTVTIANTSSKSQLIWGPFAPCTYGLSVVNVSRKTTVDTTPDECFGDTFEDPAESIWPGRATRLQFRFDGEALIGQPGTYKVSVRTITLFSTQVGKGTSSLQIASNSVSIVVTR